MTFEFYDPFVRLRGLPLHAMAAGGSPAAGGHPGGGGGAAAGGAHAGSGSKGGGGANAAIAVAIFFAILLGIYFFLPAYLGGSSIAAIVIIAILGILFLMDTSEGKQVSSFFLLVVIVFNIGVVAYLGVSIWMFIIYAVMLAILLPYIMGFFISDGSTYAERLHNPTYLTVSAIQILVFWFLKFGAHMFPALDAFLQSPLGYSLWILNAWGLFILFTYGSGSFMLRCIRFLVVAALVISALFQVYSMLSITTLGLPQANYGFVNLKTVFDSVQTSFVKFVKGIPAAYQDIQFQINRSIAVSTGTYYEGQVEDSKNEPLGVFIKNLRPIDKVQLSGNKVSVLAEISGQTFHNTIVVRVSCMARSNNGSIYTGKVEYIHADQPIQIVLKGTETVFCSWGDPQAPDDPINPILPAGHYEVQMSATFPFETWAYITYSFVDQSTYRNYYAQGKDINTELSIEKNPVAIYTAGPVSLGLASQDQPIPLSTASGDTNVYTFGGTIDNAWPMGAIEHVNEFVLKVPRPFTLDNCYPNDQFTTVLDLTGSLPDSADFNTYRITNVDPHLTFSTTTCRLTLPAGSAQTLFVNSVKPQRTFIGMVNYTYVLNQRLGIDVK